MSEELKYCKFCDKEKPIKEFCKSGGAIKNICRECQNKKQKKQYRDAKILTELEEYVEEESNKTIINIGMLQVWNLVLNKIQELKEKYK